MGYDRSTPRAIVFGPQALGGYGIRHLYTKMMGLKLDMVISNIRANSQLGQLMKMNINYLQLIVGLEEPVLTNHTEISYVEENWLLHLREYLSKINARLAIQGFWTMKPQRVRDINIMETFLKQRVKRCDLVVLNNWRIFFQVNYFSEMCSATGNRIQECFLTYPDGDIVKSQRSRITWPYQKRPDKKSFRIWTKCMRQCFIKSRNNRIPTLGPWIMEHVISENLGPAYYQHSTSSIFIPGSRRGDVFRKVETTYQRGTMARISLSEKGEMIRELPKDSVPADFQRHTRKRDTPICSVKCIAYST
jgi:hypothetical protein